MPIFFSKPQDGPEINQSSAVRLHQVARSIVIPHTSPPSTFPQGFLYLFRKDTLWGRGRQPGLTQALRIMIDGEEGKEKRNGEKLKRNPSSFEISSPITPRGWGGGWYTGWYCLFKTHLNTKLYIMSSQFRSSNV